ncbi:Xenobiotic-transporting ATPase protein [Dioscorea alata]|uniref:Xenobiotic-transporting ATPase protein n=1 Tax=Dioscorea alata TaxID=55571 RepID=A0ACB7VRJ4_DIOAL|nr:Xenobiotic-transporting ATPase protein [Dioscorea alata]
MERGKRVKSASSMSFLWMIYKQADVLDKCLMIIGFIGAAVNGLTPPFMALIASKIMNSLAGASSSTPLFIHNVNKNAVYMSCMACVSFVSCFLEGYCWTRTGERQVARLRAQYLKAVLRQDVKFFDMKVESSTEVVTCVSSDSIVIQDFLSEKMPNFIMNCSTFVGGYLVGFFIMWRLALVVFPTVVLLMIPGIIYGRILISISRKIREEYNKAGAIAGQAVSSIRTVYSFVSEQRTIKEFGVALEGSFKLGVRQGLIKGIATGSNCITIAIWALTIWYGSKQVMYHGAKGGTIYAVGVSIVTGGLAFGSAVSNIRYFSEAMSAGERIMEVMKRVPKIDSESQEGEILESFVGELEFKDVHFAYPSRPESLVLNDFNLKIPAGKIVALVGSSGSGKSTVIGLLERFYDPVFGSIQVDGVDIKKLKLKWLRSQMGLVSQEPALFATSVKENILFGKEDASMEEVVAAAKIANAHEFISNLPDGYDTQVGERGVQISGGQKQRIAIARAVIKSPKILMLDEATSALDTESEKIVQEALDTASVGRTSIVIAHRLSTVRNADMIAVVQDGHVAAMGIHEELMRDEPGLYSSLVRLQQGKGVADECSSMDSLTAVILSEDQSPGHKINEDMPNSSLKSEQKPKPVFPAPSFQRLLLLNAPEWKLGTLGCFVAMAFGAIQPLYAFAMGSMISVFFLKNHDEIKEKTRTYSLIFLSLSFLSFFSNVAQHFSFGAMGEYLTRRVREQILSKILTFEVAWFDKDENSTGAICSRLAKDAFVVRLLVGDRMSLLVQTISAIVIACTLGLVTAWRLALIMITVQPLIIICFYSRKMLLMNMSSKAVKAQLESSKLAAEAVSNHRTVTAFSSQEKILRLFELTQEAPGKENLRQSWIAGFVLAISYSFTKCVFALSFWYGGRLVSHDLLTPKALFQTFLVLVSTGQAIANAGSITSDLAIGAETVSSVFAILDHQTCIESEDPKGDSPKKLTGSVDIVDVDFAYPSRPDVLIFNNFSLSIEAGKSTALVGRSGSGKSTIIGLIERFYDPLMGYIMIDNKDIKTYHLRCLRRHIAMVGQEPVLFAGTIEENIAYGVDKSTEAEIESAARAANAHEFVSGLKDGYKTWCGDKGTQLSGGQRQRIAIARAILKNPSILLLDEATSALDTQSEKVVQDALEKVMIGRTCVVVAHRLSTIQDCDTIVVLEKGMLVEKGTHAALLEKGQSGSYFSLVSLQQRNLNV